MFAADSRAHRGQGNTGSARGHAADALGALFDVPPPVVDAALAQDICRVVFGVSGTATVLSGERDVTARIVTSPQGDGGPQTWILKVVHPDEPAEVTDLQVAVLRHLATTSPSVPAPRLHPATSGGERVTLADGRSCAVRLVSAVPGMPLSGVLSSAAGCPQRRRVDVAADLGATLARTDQALARLRHPAEDTPLLWDTAGFLQRPQPYKTIVPSEPDLADLLGGLRERIVPRLKGHPCQLIHNDANPHNVFVADSGRVTGLIDFGDLVRAPRVQDLAVALAYLLTPGRDPLAVAEAAVGGYVQVEALTEGELALLPDLMAARMAMAMAITRWRARQHPENAAYILRNHETTRLGLAELVTLGREQVAERLTSVPAAYPPGSLRHDH